MKKGIAIAAATFAVATLLSVSGIYAQQRTPRPVAPIPPEPSVSSVPSMPAIPPQPGVPAIPEVDPLGDVMFPPHLIMRHARELALTDQQKAFMRGEIQKTTTRFNDLQWQLQDAMEAFHDTMKPHSINDQQALAQLDKVLDLEREIKRLHVGMGIRIKNQLTVEQQERLRHLRLPPRPEGMPHPAVPPRQGGPPDGYPQPAPPPPAP
ncbi:MAG TPA: hypothetical protein VFH15_14830 [Pyrinomonadaceae bacterium]|nr:hypothetical protein [Pyrinomonadaceae bacterium]